MDVDYYRSIYSHVYATHDDYGRHHGASAVPLILRCLRPGGVLVDVGCGRHQLCRDVLAERPDALCYGLDIVECASVPEGVTFVSAPAWDLSSIREAIDVITSFDVLEHLYPEDVDRTLAEWGHRLGGRLIVSICYRPSRTFGPNHMNLHPTVRPKEWWIEKLAEHFDDVVEGDDGYVVADARCDSVGSTGGYTR